jgi:hypothetical protein
VFLVNSYDPTVVIKVMSSAGNPVFSPDGRIIAMSGYLSALSVDPISLSKWMHAVRNGNIFVVNTDDPDDLQGNGGISVFHRITHSRYECGTPAWTLTSRTSTTGLWNLLSSFRSMTQ